MIDLTQIVAAIDVKDYPKAIRILSRKCKTVPYRFAGNVTQCCVFLARHGRLDDIHELSKQLEAMPHTYISGKPRKQRRKQTKKV